MDTIAQSWKGRVAGDSKLLLRVSYHICLSDYEKEDEWDGPSIY